MSAIEQLMDAIAAKTAEVENASRAVHAAQQYLHRVKSELAKLKDSMAQAKTMQLEVSDHAVLRYAERVLGLDPTDVRATIKARVTPLANALGDGEYPVAGGCRAVVKNRTVVTVVPT
jgi:hypothetical protein